MDTVIFICNGFIVFERRVSMPHSHTSFITKSKKHVQHPHFYPSFPVTLSHWDVADVTAGPHPNTRKPLLLHTEACSSSRHLTQ